MAAGWMLIIITTMTIISTKYTLRLLVIIITIITVRG